MAHDPARGWAERVNEAMSKALRETVQRLGVQVDEGVDAEEEAGRAHTTALAEPPEAPRGREGRPGGPRLGQTEDAESWQEMVVQEAESELQLPVIEGARVIYLGASKRRSIALPGRIHIEEWEIEPATTRTDSETGQRVVVKPAVLERKKTVAESDAIQCYDFATHDQRGRLIGEARLMPRAAGAALGGKPYSIVEHPEHLRLFHRWRDANREHEFEVLVPKKFRSRFLDYMAEKERQIGKKQTLIEQTLKRG